MLCPVLNSLTNLEELARFLGSIRTLVLELDSEINLSKVQHFINDETQKGWNVSSNGIVCGRNVTRALTFNPLPIASSSSQMNTGFWNQRRWGQMQGSKIIHYREENVYVQDLS